MCRKFILVWVLLLSLLMTGCGSTAEPTEPMEKDAAAEAPTETLFLAYQLAICSPKLAIHSGPGYSYEIVDHITDQGDYVIIAHESENLGNGLQTTWGKLQSQQGWINLDDAQATAAVETPTPTQEPTQPEKDPGVFEPYVIQIRNQYLPIYSGPGYGYKGVGKIEGGGAYTIVEEAFEWFAGGRYVTWGRLKSGVGWICLDDARLNPNTLPPYRCTECGRADLSISRYGLCDTCHQKFDTYGYCEICGRALNFVEAGEYDGTRCFDCCVCENCGSNANTWCESYFESYDKMIYFCPVCYENLFRCISCGKSSYPEKIWGGPCEDCDDGKDYCTRCGVQLNEWNTAYNGFGKCQDCYYETLDPMYICDRCGADCSFRGVYDGLCEDCYEESLSENCWYCGAPCTGDLCEDCDDNFCDWCGDPIMEGHSCWGTE